VAFLLLVSLIVGVGTASPAQGYWSLFRSPHHIPHARPHHGGYFGAAPSSDPNALTAGQIFRGIQLFWPLVTGQPQQPNQPAAEPRVSAATSEQITKTGAAINKSVDNVNDLLKLVRKGDTRHNEKTLLDVPKTGATKPRGGAPPFGVDPNDPLPRFEPNN